MSFSLVFSFRDNISGNGFVASVAIVNGRGVLCSEDDAGAAFWLYGAQPGGLAGGGADARAALSDFRERYRSVLFDIASEAPSFFEFERDVRAFLEQQNDEVAAEWSSLHEEAKKNGVQLEAFVVQRVDASPEVKIVELDAQRTVPTFNAMDRISAAA